MGTRKTISGNNKPMERIGKKTTQGDGLRSRPKNNKKKYRGQGR
jgi:hypothetical protein